MSIIKPKALVFDIGANIGQSAAKFLKAGAGQVISVEPCIENFIQIKGDNIVPVHAACWSGHMIGKVFYCRNTSGWSSCDPDSWTTAYPAAQWNAPQFVPFITLDMLVFAFGMPQCVKVDVEGCEFQVLMGMHFRPELLIFEFHKQFLHMTDACLQLATTLGFTKGCYTVNDLDLETLPELSLPELRERLYAEKPNWGNITLT